MNVRSVFGAALCGLIVVMVGVTAAGAMRDGTLPASFAMHGCAAKVTSVDPPAGSALRPGDVVDLRALPVAGRLAFADPFDIDGVRGERIPLPIVRAGQRTTVEATFVQSGSSTPTRLGFALLGLFVYLVTGAFVLLRGRDAAAFALGAFLLCFAAGGFAFDRTAFLAPPLRIVLNLLAFAFSAGAIYAGAALNLQLSRGIFSPRAIRIVGAAATAYTAVYAAVVLVSQLTLPLAGCVMPGFGTYMLLFFGGALGVIAILGAALVRSRFAERRIAWIFWTTALCFVPFIVVRGLETLFSVEVVRSEWQRLAIEEFPFLLLPIGYAYAILRYRAVDISFVINRALVYAILSGALLGGVILAESFAEKVALDKDASLALELAVPLAVGLSFNFLHRRLELLIDRVLFSAKHRADEALRRFSAECAFIEQPATLRERATRLICEQTRAGVAAIYERRGGSYALTARYGSAPLPETIDGDDNVFVRLRAAQGIVDFDEVKSGVATAGIALPLAAGGRVEGAVVCTPRLDGERYAPDELEQLRNVAQSIANALASAYARERAEFIDIVAAGALEHGAVLERARELSNTPR